MKQIFEGIKNILETFFAENSTYNWVAGEQFIVNTTTDFIYGLDFPQFTTPAPLQTRFPQNGKLNSTAPQDFTRIFFKPISTTFITHSTTQTEIPSETEEPSHQVSVQNYNQYFARFNLIFYTKSTRPTATMDAYNFQELFFNAFRGNIPFLDYLHAQNVWQFGWEGRRVEDLSFVENASGVSRYQATMSAMYSQDTNSYILDKAQNMQIDEIKIF